MVGGGGGVTNTNTVQKNKSHKGSQILQGGRLLVLTHLASMCLLHMVLNAQKYFSSSNLQLSSRQTSQLLWLSLLATEPVKD